MHRYIYSLASLNLFQENEMVLPSWKRICSIIKSNRTCFEWLVNTLCQWSARVSSSCKPLKCNADLNTSPLAHPYYVRMFLSSSVSRAFQFRSIGKTTVWGKIRIFVHELNMNQKVIFCNFCVILKSKSELSFFFSNWIFGHKLDFAPVWVLAKLPFDFQLSCISEEDVFSRR